MEQVFFPLDEELGLLPGHFAPRQHEHLVHLACFMPFNKVVEMMQEMVSVQTHEETVRRLTEQAGSWMEAAQRAEVEADREPASKDEERLERCAFSADGAMISLVHKQWVEVRTVAIGEPQEQLTAAGEMEIHVGHLSYFSRLADVSTFTALAEGEMRRRKVREAKDVCAIMDGADWLQSFTDKHRPDALRILDFPHAAEHLTKLLEALEQAGMRFPPHMLDRCLHILKHRGPRPLLQMAAHLLSDLAERKEVNAHLDYLRKREALMQYPQFRQQGWPIGSGMVESANKNIVEARLKGPGMHWERKHVNPMLAVRNAVCNDRWQQMWQKALDHHRKLQALHRSERGKQRAHASRAVGETSSQESPPSPSAPVSEQFPPRPSRPVATPPCSSLSSTRRKRQPACHRMNASSPGSRELSQNTCLCGTPLKRFKGHRSQQYCSGRCRQRAYRQRYLQTKPPLPLASVTPLSGSSPAPAQSWRNRAAQSRSEPVNGSRQRSGGVKGETCLFCGTPLFQGPGGRMREYCSGRCRQRAYRERQRSCVDLTWTTP